MTAVSLVDLQASVQDKSAFNLLADYFNLCNAFLELVGRIQPTRIVSPTHHNYIFYQYDNTYGHKITRPLNADLFIESADVFRAVFVRFVTFLADLRRHQNVIIDQESARKYIESNEVNKAVYTVQQAIGSVGDSFDNPNQSLCRLNRWNELSK